MPTCEVPVFNETEETRQSIISKAHSNEGQPGCRLLLLRVEPLGGMLGKNILMAYFIEEVWPGMETGPESSNELCGPNVRSHLGFSHGSGSHLHTCFG